MERKTLLLNYNYDNLSFLSERRALKLIYKDKVEVLSNWDDYYYHQGKITYIPSILRLKYHVKTKNIPLSFSRRALIKRDSALCQYCCKALENNQITLDHIVPKHHGGKTTFLNCVVACYSCNNKKGARLPDQANMKLIKQPTIPMLSAIRNVERDSQWHKDWEFYLIKY